MRRWIPVLTSLCVASAQASECVVLLHGLGRSSMSMNRMERKLEHAGFETANIDYPSREHTVEELADIAVSAGLESCRSREGM